MSNTVMPLVFGESGSNDEIPNKPPSLYSSCHDKTTRNDYYCDRHVVDIFVQQIEKHATKRKQFKILYPGQDDFEIIRHDLYNYDEICTPALIIQPAGSSDVSSILRGYNAGLKICIRRNRHIKKTNNSHDSKSDTSYLKIPRLCIAGGRTSTSSFKEGAIVLDLSLMKRIVVNKDDLSVTCQGGVTVQDVDRATTEHKLMCVLGANQNIGVVGSILSGGYGVGSRLYGLSCDNVLSANIVVGDGSFKRCSPDSRHEDLFWSLCGGGGGIGVITSITLKCYPICNTALVMSSLSASTIKNRMRLIKEWSSWINDTPNEVFSQLVLPTKSSTFPILASSICTEQIPQSEDYLQLYDNANTNETKRYIIPGANRGNGLKFWKKKQQPDQQRQIHHSPIRCEDVRGLGEFKTNKVLGAATNPRNKGFRLLRYYDLQKTISSKFSNPGNIYISYKYAHSITDIIIKLLVSAISVKKAPNNECQIILSSIGGATCTPATDEIAFDSRDMEFVIQIEGRWSDSDSQRRDQREKANVVEWVQWLSNTLHTCQGVRSTTHAESCRDQRSNKHPKPGYYNFGLENGERLNMIKRHRDPRNIFSLASRISPGNYLGNSNLEAFQSSNTKTIDVGYLINKALENEDGHANAPVQQADDTSVSWSEDSNNHDGPDEEKHQKAVNDGVNENEDDATSIHSLSHEEEGIFDTDLDGDELDEVSLQKEFEEWEEQQEESAKPTTMASV